MKVARKLGRWYMERFSVYSGRSYELGGTVILFAIGIMIAAAVLPQAIGNIETASTSGWSTNAKNIWSIVGVIIVAVFVLGLYKTGTVGRGRGRS